MSDVSRLQQELVDHPSPMLYGPPEVVDGWCSLEFHERGNALRVLRAYGTEVSLWYRGLFLLKNGFLGGAEVWKIPQDEPAHSATRTRINLLGLEVSSAKSALDLTLAGSYSIAFASIRHMLEATAQGMYLYLFPDKHLNWDPEAKSPGMREVINSIKTELQAQGYSSQEVEQFESLYTSWKLMCKGSHPSGTGLLQVIAESDEPKNVVGASYRPRFIDVAFDHGIFAILMLLIAFPQLRVMEQDWNDTFLRWLDDRQHWRQSLREKYGLGADLDQGAVTSADVQI